MEKGQEKMKKHLNLIHMKEKYVPTVIKELHLMEWLV